MNQTLHYDKVTLVPNKCVVSSRADCDTTVNFCGYIFDLPVVPANMVSVIDQKVAKWLAFNKHFYIYHRFGNTRAFISDANHEKWPLISISVGVKQFDEDFINWLATTKYKVDFITIDVAHGFSGSVERMIQHIKFRLPDVKVVAGNVWGDKKSIEFLQDAGADVIKVGLSCGAGCSTYNETGFGSPMFTAALGAGRHSKVPIILDGGVRQNADIAKALVGCLSSQTDYVYGGRTGFVFRKQLHVPMVMMGSVLAACADAPGETRLVATNNGNQGECRTYKRYYGSASAESKTKTGQEVKHVEGKTVMLECNNLTYAQKYGQIKGAIQSQISYAGGTDLTALKDVKWMTV